ncbi:MAG: thioesterase [Bacillota bacterium]|nr:thioesterase [Bacillota bacterium]
MKEGIIFSGKGWCFENTMYELIKDYEAGAGQTDCFGMLRPSALIEFMQDAATLHADSLGVSRENLMLNNGVFWLMARQRYFLSRPVISKEKVTVSTWHRKTAGYIWYRDFSFCINGETVGGANSIWIAADCVTHKMVDLSAAVGKLRSEHPVKNTGPEVKKVKLPHDMKSSGSHRVCYTDLDINGHLNNVKAADVICNVLNLHERMSGGYISELQIDYLKESRPCDEIELFTSDGEDAAYVSGVCRGEQRFEARMVFSRL